MVIVMNYMSLNFKNTQVRICIVMHKNGLSHKTVSDSKNPKLWHCNDNKLLLFNLKNSEDTNKESKLITTLCKAISLNPYLEIYAG